MVEQSGLGEIMTSVAFHERPVTLSRPFFFFFFFFFQALSSPVFPRLGGAWKKRKKKSTDSTTFLANRPPAPLDVRPSTSPS